MKCNPKHETWYDSSGWSCEIYGSGYEQASEGQWCTADGQYGDGWEENWGTFEDLKTGDYSALNCPQCGCDKTTLVSFTRELNTPLDNLDDLYKAFKDEAREIFGIQSVEYWYILMPITNLHDLMTTFYSKNKLATCEDMESKSPSDSISMRLSERCPTLVGLVDQFEAWPVENSFICENQNRKIGKQIRRVKNRLTQKCK